MNPIVRHAFFEELEKIAATTKELAAAARRLNPIDVGSTRGSIRSIVKHGPRRWFLANQSNTAQSMAAHSGDLARAIRVPNPAGMTMTTAQQKGRRALIRAAAGDSESAKAIIERLGETSPEAAGMIYTTGPRNASMVAAASAGQNSRKLSRAGRDALHDALVLHEGFERGVRPKDVNIGYSDEYGHMGPGVIINEHNMLSKMSGPGSDEARKVVRAIREAPGREMDDLRESFRGAYGPRAERYLRDGNRVPKAMKKNYLRRIRKSHWGEEPMTFDAKPGTPAQGRTVGEKLRRIESREK